MNHEAESEREPKFAEAAQQRRSERWGDRNAHALQCNRRRDLHDANAPEDGSNQKKEEPHHVGDQRHGNVGILSNGPQAGIEYGRPTQANGEGKSEGPPQV